MPQISNPTNDRRSLTQTFQEVGEDYGELMQNTPGLNSPVLEWTCPRKFEQIAYSGGRHKTKFVPRYKQSVSSASGGTETVSLNGTMQPVAGETEADEWPHPPVVAYNETQDTEITHDLEIDYSGNAVTLPSGTSSGDAVHLFPILVDGTLQYRGQDQFGHEIAPLDEWSTQLHVFHDFDQRQSTTEIHLIGAATWTEDQTLTLFIESDQQIVWEDPMYPRGQFASTIEQRVDITV